MKCAICGKNYELKNTHGGAPKKRPTCGSNSCQAKWQYQQNPNWFKKRARNQYWIEKETNYDKLRKRNLEAQYRKRFGISKSELLKRANNQCENCGSSKNLLIHHIDNQGRKVQNLGVKPNNDPKNLMVLCKSCHNGHHHHGWVLKKKT